MSPSPSYIPICCTINSCRYSPFRQGWDNKCFIPIDEGTHCSPQNDVTQHNPSGNSSGIENTSSGWLAKYEILEVHNTKSSKIVSFSIPLESDDIRLCLQQSLARSPLGHWNCSFPLSIAPGQEVFTVLNKIFYFRIDHTESYKTDAIPLDFDLRLKMTWSSRCLPAQSRSNYSYRIVWSPDSTRFAFIDLLGPNPSNEQAMCLAIFEAFNFTHAKPPELIRNIFRPAPYTGLLTDYQFHPNPMENLFLFRSDDEVYIWLFNGIVTATALSISLSS